MRLLNYTLNDSELLQDDVAEWAIFRDGFNPQFLKRINYWKGTFCFHELREWMKGDKKK